MTSSSSKGWEGDDDSLDIDSDVIENEIDDTLELIDGNNVDDGMRKMALPNNDQDESNITKQDHTDQDSQGEEDSIEKEVDISINESDEMAAHVYQEKVQATSTIEVDDPISLINESDEDAALDDKKGKAPTIEKSDNDQVDDSNSMADESDEIAKHIDEEESTIEKLSIDQDEDPEPQSEVPNTMAGGGGGWGGWFASVQSFGSDQLDRIYNALDPVLTEENDAEGKEIVQSASMNSSSESVEVKTKALLDKLSPTGSSENEGKNGSTAISLLRGFDVAADVLGLAVVGGLRKIEETTGYRIEPLVDSLSSSVGSLRSSLGSSTSSSSKDSLKDDDIDKGKSVVDDDEETSTILSKQPKDNSQPIVSPTPKESTGHIRVVSEQVVSSVSSGLSALELLGKTTAGIVRAHLARPLEGSDLDEDDAGATAIDPSDLSLSFDDLFAQSSGPKSMEDLQVLSSKAAIKLKTHLRSLTPKQLSTLKPRLADIDELFSQEGRLSGEHMNLLAYQTNRQSILAEEAFWSESPITDPELRQMFRTEFSRVATFALDPTTEISSSLAILTNDNQDDGNGESDDERSALVTSVAGFRYRVALTRYAVTAMMVLAKLAALASSDDQPPTIESASKHCSRLLEEFMWIVLLLEDHATTGTLRKSKADEPIGSEGNSEDSFDSEELIQRIRADAKVCQSMITDSAYCLAPLYKLSLLKT